MDKINHNGSLISGDCYTPRQSYQPRPDALSCFISEAGIIMS